MKNCNFCANEYDEVNLQIPTPIPDKMCAECGTILSDEEIANLIPETSPVSMEQIQQFIP